MSSIIESSAIGEIVLHFPRQALARELVAALRGETVFSDARNGLFLATPDGEIDGPAVRSQASTGGCGSSGGLCGPVGCPAARTPSTTRPCVVGSGNACGMDTGRRSTRKVRWSWTPRMTPRRTRSTRISSPDVPAPRARTRMVGIGTTAGSVIGVLGADGGKG